MPHVAEHDLLGWPRVSTMPFHWLLLLVAEASPCSGCLQARVTLDEEYGANFRRGVGPVNCTFAIPMYCASRLQVRYLQILKNDKNYSPYRWVRYVTMSSSYTFRI